MISIRRAPDWPTVDVYTKLVPCKRNSGREDTKYGHEKSHAIEFHQDPNNFADEERLAAESFKSYSVYKNPKLRAKLDGEFNGKCAYCEGNGSETAGKDIEHFRPKGEIVADNQKLVPGYYWLAGDWDNLLLSCQACNRPGSHLFPNDDTKRVGGKRTEFPLSNESLRARSPGDDLGQEETVRLLLNPCRENPELELKYDDEGRIFAADCGDGRSSAKGERSIDIYSLDRMNLCLARKMELRRLQVLIDSLRAHLFLFTNGDDRVSHENIIGELFDDIIEAFNPHAIYLGIKRYWLREQLALMAFSDIESLGIDLRVLVD